jgi:hypothetical protein
MRVPKDKGCTKESKKKEKDGTPRLSNCIHPSIHPSNGTQSATNKRRKNEMQGETAKILSRFVCEILFFTAEKSRGLI